MGLYREILTIVVRPGAGITTTADLVGKRLDIGHPASGRRATVERVIAALGLKREDFSQIAELPTGNALDALCQGSIDATVLIIGHPNAAVGRAISKCGAILVPIIKGSQIEQALEDTLHLDRATIPGGSYPNLSKDVPSFALVATMVTRADTDDDIVKALVRSTLANLQLLGQNAPVLIHLDPVEMRTRGLAAPLHTGAQVAFDEVGPAR
jgi:TRAP transporter TAXI family solute receptor